MAAAGGAGISDTVDYYDRHVILCYKSPESWPSNFELSEADPLPQKLFSAFNARKDQMERKTILTVTQGGKDDPYFADGDIFIFPDMIKYSGVKEKDDFDEFVEDVLVKSTRWRKEMYELMIETVYIFVCAHEGDAVLEHIKDLVMWNDMRDTLFVRPCSGMQGRRDLAPTLIIYSRNGMQQVDGHWYGLVTPSTVTEILESHIGSGFIYEQLWRGNMGPKWEPPVPGWDRFQRGTRSESLHMKRRF